MTWDEWEQARGRAAGQGVGVRLDQLPVQRSTPGGGAGGPDLASRPAEKKAAARAIEEHLEPGTRKSGAWADEETAAAVKEFGARDGHGWVTSGALKRAHKAWSDQVKALMDRLGAEKDALRSTSALFQKTDVGVGAQVRRPSGLDLL
ncbi:hypothetical protein [Streptomyces sp. NPDC054842]